MSESKTNVINVANAEYERLKEFDIANDIVVQLKGKAPEKEGEVLSLIAAYFGFRLQAY